jgi:citrate synthase
MSAPVDTPKPKKSVALSGVTAGNTALCSVGKSGNDLHYRGYDILEVAETCEFEEIAYLLIHGKLPNIHELAAYKTRLKSLRGIPAPVWAILGSFPSHAPHGRHAHRRFRARLRAQPTTTTPQARARSPTTWWRLRVDALLLVSLLASSRPSTWKRQHRGRHFLHLLPVAAARAGCARCTPRSISMRNMSSTHPLSPRA